MPIRVKPLRKGTPTGKPGERKMGRNTFKVSSSLLKADLKNKMPNKPSKGGGADMGKVTSNKKISEAEKRMKAASKFSKKQGRSFYSLMREKYMR